MKSRRKFGWLCAVSTLIGNVRIIVMCGFIGQSMAGDPRVLWHSKPVKPGQSVLIYGDELAAAQVVGGRLDDGLAGMPGDEKGAVPNFKSRRLTVIQARKRALKAIPPDEARGVYALTVGADPHSHRILVNAP